jgi:hypothetical protein
MIRFAEPKTPEQALTLGLFLSLTAPTDELSQEIAVDVEHFAALLDPETIEMCKAAALERAEVQWALEGSA